MIRCAIINTKTNAVENVIEYDVQPTSPPPGFDGNYIAVANDAAGTDWTWTGTALVAPIAPPPIPVPQLVLSQDLVAQFTVADYALIKAATAANDRFGLLWAALQAQNDPMVVTNARFLAGWSALVTVLGQTRMSAISSALGVTIDS
jgi:hypothetical protein